MLLLTVLMTRMAWNQLAAGLIASCAFTACGVPDPAQYDAPRRFSTERALCSATLEVTGRLEDSRAMPQDVVGCWPVGTWRFTATVKPDSSTCDQDPELDSEYAFLVDRDEDSKETYVYMNDPSYSRVFVKVTSGGGGLCEGGLEIYSEKGTEVWNFKPSLLADETIIGFGEYDEYDKDQW